MGVSTQTARIRAQQATTPKINHISVTATEISFVTETSVKKILIQNHSAANIRLSWVEDGTGAGTNEYIVIPKCASRDIDGIGFSGTMYLLSESGSQTVYVEQWV